MIRHFLRKITIPLAVVLLLSAVMVPGVLAKGRPTKAEITQVSCGGLTVSTTWSKKLSVHGIVGTVSINGSAPQYTFTRTSSLGISSPSSFTLTFLQFSRPSTTYSVDLRLFAEEATQTLLDEVTASATIAC